TPRQTCSTLPLKDTYWTPIAWSHSDPLPSSLGEMSYLKVFHCINIIIIIIIIIATTTTKTPKRLSIGCHTLWRSTYWGSIVSFVTLLSYSVAFYRKANIPFRSELLFPKWNPVRG